MTTLQNTIDRLWRRHAALLRRAVPVIAAILFACFVWPTLYHYQSVAGKLVRVNRVTGEAESVRIAGPPTRK